MKGKMDELGLAGKISKLQDQEEQMITDNQYNERLKVAHSLG